MRLKTIAKRLRPNLKVHQPKAGPETMLVGRGGDGQPGEKRVISILIYHCTTLVLFPLGRVMRALPKSKQHQTTRAGSETVMAMGYFLL